MSDFGKEISENVSKSFKSVETLLAIDEEKDLQNTRMKSKESEQQVVKIDEVNGSTNLETPQEIVNDVEVLEIKSSTSKLIESTAASVDMDLGKRQGAYPKTNVGVKKSKGPYNGDSVSSSSSSSDMDIRETTVELLYDRYLYSRLSRVINNIQTMEEIINSDEAFDEDKFINSCRLFNFHAKSFYNYLLKARVIISVEKYKYFKYMLDEYFKTNQFLRKQVLNSKKIKLTDKLKMYATSEEEEFERKDWTQVHRERTHIILHEADLKKDMIEIANLSGCLVEIQGISRTLYIKNCSTSVFLCGPTINSAIIRNCTGSAFFISCTRLIIDESKKCQFYTQVVQDTTLERSKDIKFGYYEYCYPKIETDFENVGRCMYDEGSRAVYDVSCKKSQEPNWCYFHDLGDRLTSIELKMKFISELRFDMKFIDDEPPRTSVSKIGAMVDLLYPKPVAEKTIITEITSDTDSVDTTKKTSFSKELVYEESAINTSFVCSQAKDTSSPSSPTKDTSSPCSPTKDTSSPCSPTKDTSSPCSPTKDTSSPCSPVKDTSLPCSPVKNTSSLCSPAKDMSLPCSQAKGSLFNTPISSRVQSPEKRYSAVGKPDAKQTSVSNDIYEDMSNAEPIVPKLFASDDKEKCDFNQGIAIKEKQQSETVLALKDFSNTAPADGEI